MQITKEQIVDLKQKLAAVKEGKKVVEWAKDEALRAKERLCLPGHRPSTPRRRSRRRPTTWEWPRLKPPLRLKFLGYVGSTIPRFGMRPSSKLGFI